MTYNIHSGVGTNGAYDLERVAGVIRRSKAEIACLQEAVGWIFGVVRLEGWQNGFGAFYLKERLIWLMR